MQNVKKFTRAGFFEKKNLPEKHINRDKSCFVTKERKLESETWKVVMLCYVRQTSLNRKVIKVKLGKFLQQKHGELTNTSFMPMKPPKNMKS